MGDTSSKAKESLEGETAPGGTRAERDLFEMEKLQPTPPLTPNDDPVAIASTTYLNFKVRLEPYIEYLWAIENQRPGLVDTLESLILYVLQTAQIPSPFHAEPAESLTHLKNSTRSASTSDLSAVLPEIIVPTETEEIHNEDDVLDLYPHPSEVDMTASLLETPAKAPTETHPEEVFLDLQPHFIEVEMTHSPLKTPPMSPTVHLKKVLDLHPHSDEIEITACLLKTPPKTTTKTYSEEDILDLHPHPSEFEMTLSPLKPLCKTPVETYPVEDILDLHPLSSDLDITASPSKSLLKTTTTIHLEEEVLDLHQVSREVEMTTSPLSTPTQILLDAPNQRAETSTPDPSPPIMKEGTRIECFSTNVSSPATTISIPAVTITPNNIALTPNIPQLKKFSQKKSPRYPAGTYIPWPGPVFDPDYPNERWCFACHKMGHIRGKCSNPRTDFYCRLCGALGTSTYKCKWTIVHQQWQKGVYTRNPPLISTSTNSTEVPRVPHAIPPAAPKPLMDMKIFPPPLLHPYRTTSPPQSVSPPTPTMSTTSPTAFTATEALDWYFPTEPIPPTIIPSESTPTPPPVYAPAAPQLLYEMNPEYQSEACSFIIEEEQSMVRDIHSRLGYNCPRKKRRRR